MALKDEIEAKRAEIHSDRLSMSIGELQGLYERGELDIHPKFQRLLRWSEEQKSKLIESILLRIPVPPIFVAQDEKGRWDVVDGVQRLGTIFEFLGVLRDRDRELRPPLVLQATKLLPSLKAKQFTAGASQGFDEPQQLDFKRSRLDLHIILKESDPSSKYELFERLNTGGSRASDQEVRNCVLVWMNEPFFDWMLNLSKSQAIVECIQVTERLEEQQYRMELLLRFLAFCRVDDSALAIDDMGEFLNEQNRALAGDPKFDMKGEAATVEEVFGLLQKALGSDVFRKYDGQAFRGGFLISAFEAVALGVAANISKWRKASDAATKLEARVKRMWQETEFTGHIGSGVPARTRIQYSIPFGRKHFAP